MCKLFPGKIILALSLLAIFYISEAEKIPWRKEMGTHSSILDWEIPWTEEPGGL